MTRQNYGGLIFNFFNEDEGGKVREGLNEYTYLIMLTKLWTKYWDNKLERMNTRVDEENGRAVGMGK